ncbi:hypothetical protein AB0D34_23270 [Streptomyces sp. NPDC048420]|uniref:hypothetical protein n=1 Tax=Streptomyces sp. NPDC048420 TaxID=3155755 RepID=UPI00343E216D
MQAMRGRSRETVESSDLAGWAPYGYRAGHTCLFWGLRVGCAWCARSRACPSPFALTGAEADERETVLDLFAAEPHLLTARPGQTLIGDTNHFGRGFPRALAEYGLQLLRPTCEGERRRPGGSLLKPLRQVIESINEIFKGQLDLEQHRGRTRGGLIAGGGAAGPGLQVLPGVQSFPQGLENQWGDVSAGP